VVLSEAVYGGVYRLSTQLLVHFGLEFSFVDTASPELVLAAMRANTRMLYIETPTNPTMRITDIAAIAKIAGERNALLVVDNTFLSPYLQSPIALGAHIVVHSMTKYLNGHSDSTGGCVVLTRPEDAEKIYFIQRSAGAVLGADGLFFGFARNQDAGDSDAAAQCQRNCGGSTPGCSCESPQGVLPRAAFASAA